MLVALPGGWFKPGTEVKVVASFGEGGLLLSGARVCERPSEGRAVGEEYEDEEVCDPDEVEEVP